MNKEQWINEQTARIMKVKEVEMPEESLKIFLEYLWDLAEEEGLNPHDNNILPESIYFSNGQKTMD